MAVLIIKVKTLKKSTSREQLERVIETIAEGIYIISVDGFIIYANNSAEQILGVKKSDLIGRPYKSPGYKVTTLEGKPYPVEERPITQALKIGKLVRNVEYAIIRPDGHKVIISVNAAPLHDERGNIIGVVISATDITARKLTEESLRESERRFREMLEGVELIAVILDSQGNITFANDYLISLTGWRREEIVGRSWFNLFIPPESRQEIEKVFREVITRGVPARWENNILMREGEIRTVSFSNVLLRGPQGNAIGVASIGHDITREKQAAEEIRDSRKQVLDILESITDGFFALDNDWRFTYINRKATQLIGKRKEELLFRNIWEVLPELEGTIFYQEYCRAKKEMVPIAFRALYFLQNKWFEVHVYPYEKGLSVYISDITEREREKELSDALNDINIAITSTLNFNEVMQRVVAESAKAIGSEAAAILLREGNLWVAKCLAGFPQELAGARLTDDEARVLMLAAKARRPVTIDDALHDGRVSSKVMEKYNIRSLLAIPLIMREDIIGVLFFSYQSAPIAFTKAQINFANKLTGTISLAMENSKLYETEYHVAKTLQDALLTVPEKVDHLEYGYLYHSATEAVRVGGDFYDLFELEHDRVGLTIGDISGKGLEAAALTAVVKNTIRAYALEGYDPAQIMAKTNDAIAAVTSSSSFVTVFFAIFNKGTKELLYCNAGHPPAIIRRKSLTVELLEEYSPIIGAFTDMHYENGETVLNNGDILIFYTDGIIEARQDSEFFEEKRLIEFVRELSSAFAKEVPRLIFDEVLRFSGGRLLDDVALLAIAYKGE